MTRAAAVPVRSVLDVPREPDPARIRATYLWGMTMHLVGRELSSRYRRSVAGWVWALIPPLIQLAVYNFVFTQVLPVASSQHFSVFLLIGILSWNWFAGGLTLATTSLEARRQFVLRPGFPTALLPCVSVVVALADYLIALPVLLVATAFAVGLHAAVTILPALLLIQLVLMLGLALLLAPANVFFRDVSHFVGVALTFGFWLTPIFYAQTLVPDRFAAVYEFNPIARLLAAQREALLVGTFPRLLPIAVVGAVSLAVAVAGFLTFQRVRHALPEQL